MSAVQSYFDTIYFPINFGRASTLRRTVGRLFRRESHRIAEHGCDLVRPHAPRSVLDLGCGTGDLLSALSAEHALERAVGVDISAPALARARERLSGLAGVSFEQADVRSCRALESTHDAVLAIGLFDYVRLDAPALRALLAAASRVVVVTLPRRRVTAQRVARTAWLAMNGVALRAYGAADVASLSAEAQRAGFACEVTRAPELADNLWLVCVRRGERALSA